MVSTFDFQPEPSPASPMTLARRAGGWCLHVKEAALERYRDWRFDRDVWKIHTVFEQLSDRQLDLILDLPLGCVGGGEGKDEAANALRAPMVLPMPEELV